MRTGWLIGFVFFLLTAACKDNKGVPDKVLPQEKMQTILWDLLRADQFLTDYVLNKDSAPDKQTESQKYYQKVFDIHNITREEFQRSFTFYQSRPALMKAMMDSIRVPDVVAPPKPIDSAVQIP